MLGNVIRLPLMLIREAVSGPRLERCPEPSQEMDTPANVSAFHAQGAPGGVMLPIYHFNALAMSRLVPEGGTVLDLGSGSGQYLGYLAQCRPDIRIIGIDLSPEMVRVGRASLSKSAVAAQIDLREGDMTELQAFEGEPIHAISSIFALHHLPAMADLDRCLCQIARLRHQNGCAVWLFDHARPCHPRTAELFPRIMTPTAPELFCCDSRNSLRASWSFAELSRKIDQASLEGIRHVRARLMPLYHVHWVPPTNPVPPGPWRSAAPLPAATARQFRAFRALFANCPL